MSKKDKNTPADEQPVVAGQSVAPEAAQSQEPTPAEQPEATPEEQLAAAQEEIAALKNELLYKAAEFDNYRKRTLKEKADLILNGGERTLTELLPVLDDMERAEQNISASADAESLHEGLKLVFKKLKDTLTRLGLKRIDTDGKDFDVDFHEAIALVPVEDPAQKGKVIDCVATGYMLNDKVIRHAKVAVGQ